LPGLTSWFALKLCDEAGTNTHFILGGPMAWHYQCYQGMTGNMYVCQHCHLAVYNKSAYMHMPSRD